jgi:putative FmdB family regulatory protein
MPLYEYQCEQCGDMIEVLQKFSDEPLSRCRVCSGKLKKLISRSSFQLKGSGWYLTDYSRKNSPGGEKIKEPNKDKPDSKIDETKPDSKS